MLHEEVFLPQSTQFPTIDNYCITARDFRYSGFIFKKIKALFYSKETKSSLIESFSLKFEIYSAKLMLLSYEIHARFLCYNTLELTASRFRAYVNQGIFHCFPQWVD